MARLHHDNHQTELGEFGWWQRANTLLLWLPALAAGANVMVIMIMIMMHLRRDDDVAFTVNLISAPTSSAADV